MAKIALRIDDIGASTKQFEQYTRNRWLNVGILKDRRLFGAWGPYREMTVKEWEEVYALLREQKAKLTVAITGCWVEDDASLTPFPEKFPEEARILKAGMEEGLLEIAGHGLTHCIVDGGRFRPRFLGSNRTFHREFWNWVPDPVHHASVTRSLEILEKYFGEKITSYVPPGNVYAAATLEACRRNGIKVVNCHNPKLPAPAPVRVVGNEQVLSFHDREIVLEGAAWLQKKIIEYPKDTEFCFVRDL
ncbi:MAG: polysaccharide deacetylase family protein [Bacteriovoracia bacterium]